jgi:hypothetical protein
MAVSSETQMTAIVKRLNAIATTRSVAMKRRYVVLTQRRLCDILMTPAAWSLERNTALTAPRLVHGHYWRLIMAAM